MLARPRSRRLLNERVGPRQLREVSPELWRGLSQLLAYDGDVESTFLAEFAVESNAYGEVTPSFAWPAQHPATTVHPTGKLRSNSPPRALLAR